MQPGTDRKLAVILHADVVGSTTLVQRNETLAHQRIQAAFGQASAIISEQGGTTLELRGDALVAEFSKVSDAVAASLAVQSASAASNESIPDDVVPRIRIGIAMGEVVVADNTVTGEGVVMAQRLEQLADPGGVCLQDAAYQTVPKRLPFEYRALGEHQLKGFEEPVRVYAVSEPSGHPAPAAAGPSVSAAVPPAPALPDKPSIAVLPFTNLSADPDQEYFSDGISEDIITELSRFPELFVIARNSSFVFKGAPVDTRAVGRQLGVQYVVEGSVRKAGNQARITVQLVEAASGTQLWADKYDLQLENIFAVQDDVTHAIVAVLPGRIAEARLETRRRSPTTNPSAYDCLMRANHVLQRRGDAISQAIELYREAVALDSQFAAAYAGIAVAEGMTVWDLSYYDDNPLDRAYEAGKRAIELDSSDYRCHAAFGEALRQLGRHALARQHLERAMTLNPNSARVLGYWAMLLAYTGDPAGAIDTYHRAARLDPFSADSLRLEVPAEAYYLMGEYEQSLAVLEAMLKLPIFYVHQQMAICHAQLGDTEACERSMAAYREQLPDSYDERLLYESHLRLCAHEDDREHWRQGYRLIGMDV